MCPACVCVYSCLCLACVHVCVSKGVFKCGMIQSECGGNIARAPAGDGRTARRTATPTHEHEYHTRKAFGTRAPQSQHTTREEKARPPRQCSYSKESVQSSVSCGASSPKKRQSGSLWLQPQPQPFARGERAQRGKQSPQLPMRLCCGESAREGCQYSEIEGAGGRPVGQAPGGASCCARREITGLGPPIRNLNLDSITYPHAYRQSQW